MKLNNASSFRGSANTEFNTMFKETVWSAAKTYANDNITQGHIDIDVEPASYKIKMKYTKPDGDVVKFRTFETNANLNDKKQTENFFNTIINSALKRKFPTKIFEHIETHDYYFDCFKNKVKSEMPQGKDSLTLNSNDWFSLGASPQFILKVKPNKDSSFDINMRVESKEKQKTFDAKLVLTKEGIIHTPDKKNFSEEEKEAAECLKTYINAC